MPAEELSDEARKRNARRIYAGIFLSVSQSCMQLQAEPMLVAQLCGGDVIRYRWDQVPRYKLSI
jgi:hypothetical protein